MEELKARLDEKSRQLEKKTGTALAAAHELAELRDHSEIKDRKINVLQRKVNIAIVELYRLKVDKMFERIVRTGHKLS